MYQCDLNSLSLKVIEKVSYLLGKLIVPRVALSDVKDGCCIVYTNCNTKYTN